jgi:hypothetical protein
LSYESVSWEGPSSRLYTLFFSSAAAAAAAAKRPLLQHQSAVKRLRRTRGHNAKRASSINRRQFINEKYSSKGAKVGRFGKNA